MPLTDPESVSQVPPQVRQGVDLIRDAHDPSARDLPWREAATPFGILVCETMAQQTQAERIGPRWTEFMTRFPTASALAAAPVAEVITRWTGLGYNRRAVNLHRAATQIAQQHGGEVPEGLEALLALPGVGPYTARAVLSFAHGWQVVPVDVNVARVLARLAGEALPAPAVQRAADAVAGPSAAATAAALMDLGSTTCRARRPVCEACPASGACAWAGGPGPDPAAGGAHRPRPQGQFSGSVRQARGRVVEGLRSGPLTEVEALALAGPSGRAVLDALVADGLAEEVGTTFALPGTGGKA